MKINKFIYYSLFYLVCLVWNPVFVVSQTAMQQRQVDSLWQLIEAMPNDSNMVKQRIEMIRLSINFDMEETKRLGYETLQIAQSIGYQLGMARAHTHLGQVLSYQNKFDQSLDHFLSAERIFQQVGTEYQKAFIGYQKAVAYGMMGQNERALKLYFDYLEKMRRIGRKGQEINALTNIATTYNMLFKPDSALIFFQLALPLSDSLKNDIGTLSIITNMGLVYRNQNKLDESISLCEKYLPLAKSTGAIREEAFLLSTIGDSYIRKAKQEPANTRMARFYAEKGIQYSMDARKTCLEQRLLDEQISVTYSISEGYTLLGKYEQAYLYLKESHSVRDTVDASKNSDLIASIEQKHKEESDRYEAEVAALKNQQQQTVLWVLGIGLAGLAFWLGLLYRLRQRSERLLLKILPHSIARRLKTGENPLADHFSEVSVIFVDLVNFTELSSWVDPNTLVHWLNELFVQYDQICQKHGLEKIKTIGDCYMAVAGIPIPMTRHAEKTVAFARDILTLMHTVKTPTGQPIQVRIGCDSGAAVAGVIGEYKFTYDLWGDTVNTAARMEANGVAGSIHCTAQFMQALGPDFAQKALSRGQIEIKGKGLMQTWLMTEA